MGNLSRFAKVGLVLAMLAPMALYFVLFTALRLRGSPRIFVLLIYPLMVGIRVVRVEPMEHLAGRKGSRGSDAVRVRLRGRAAVRRLLLRGNPRLRQLAAQLPSKEVLLAGAQADMNNYYFKDSPQLPVSDSVAETLGVLRSATTPTPYVLVGMECREEAAPDFERMGYHAVEHLPDWSYIEDLRGERQPCFVLYRRPASPLSQ